MGCCLSNAPDGTSAITHMDLYLCLRHPEWRNLIFEFWNKSVITSLVFWFDISDLMYRIYGSKCLLIILLSNSSITVTGVRSNHNYLGLADYINIIQRCVSCTEWTYHLIIIQRLSSWMFSIIMKASECIGLPLYRRCYF